MSAAVAALGAACLTVGLSCALSPLLHAAHPRPQHSFDSETAFDRAHAMHERLSQRPVSERRPADYQAIIAVLQPVWDSAPAGEPAQEARFEAAAIALAEARELRTSTPYQQAQALLASAMKAAPYSGYRRNIEWALAQIELFHTDQRAAALGWLRDFVSRYPADPRSEIAREQIHGKRVAEPELIAPPESARHAIAVAAPADRRHNAARRASEELKTAPEDHRDNHGGATPVASARDRQRAGAKPANERLSARATVSAAERLDGIDPVAAAAGVHEIVLAHRPAHREHGPAELLGMHVWSNGGSSSLVLDLSRETTFTFGRIPELHRIYFDLADSELGGGRGSARLSVGDGRIVEVHAAENRPGVVRVVVRLEEAAKGSDEGRFYPNPARLIVMVRGSAARTAVSHQRAEHELKASVASAARVKSPAVPARPQPTNVRTAMASVTEASSAVSQPKPSGNRGMAPAGNPNEDDAQLVASLPNAVAGSGEVKPVAAAVRPAGVRTGATSTGLEGSATTPLTRTVATPPRVPAGPAPAPTVTDLTPAPLAATAETARAATPAGGRSGNSHAPARVGALEREAAPMAEGRRSLTRVLGLKIGRIVLDAGHGGHDTGTIGVGGLEEKTVVLDVTRRLGRLLQQRMGVDVIYTRADDTFIPLQERTAIANRAKADLFISIHANSSPDADARGIETYYLSLPRGRRAEAVAARENAGGELSEHDLESVLQKIELNDKLAESRELAIDLEGSLAGATDEEQRGVKTAPFVVLIGAQMPSVLAEISFLSNRADAHLLREPRYREKIAEALYAGIQRYVHSLSGVKAVSRPARVEDAREWAEAETSALRVGGVELVRAGSR